MAAVRPGDRSASRSDGPSDAFVFFGATGDLAFKQIFPALLGLIRDEGFDMPIIGVARSGDLDALRERARQSLAAAGVVDGTAVDALTTRLRYVKGSDEDRETFRALRRELAEARHPLHYLAIPPALFGTVITHLKASGCAEGARVILEKPFGRDQRSGLLGGRERPGPGLRSHGANACGRHGPLSSAALRPAADLTIRGRATCLPAIS